MERYKSTELFHIISTIYKEISYMNKDKSELQGITKVETIYIRIIYENPGLTQYEIAKLMNITKTLVIKHISNLQKKNIVIKKDTDTYKKLIYLTEKGIEAYQYIDELVGLLEHVLFKDIPSTDVDTYMEISYCIAKKLTEFNQRKTNESDTLYTK